MIPRNFNRLDLTVTCRRVCVCIKHYNLEHKIESLNELAVNMSVPGIKVTSRQLALITVCGHDRIPPTSYIDRTCTCDSCSTAAVLDFYHPLTEKVGVAEISLKYNLWETISENYGDKAGSMKKVKRWAQ